MNLKSERYVVDKIRFCTDCSKELLVPRNSCRKRCDDCNLVANRLKCKLYARRNAHKYRERNNLKSKLVRVQKPEHAILTRTKTRAKSTGLQCDITIEDIIIPDVCPVLGTKFVYGTEYTPSIDRIDNSKGYIKGNIQIISWKANAMKNSATNEELIKFANWVHSTVKSTTE